MNEEYEIAYKELLKEIENRAPEIPADEAKQMAADGAKAIAEGIWVSAEIWPWARFMVETWRGKQWMKRLAFCNKNPAPRRG